MSSIFNRQNFNNLSLGDLIKARDQFHLHLMEKKNVVGTAVGLYLIRKDDPYPQKKDDWAAQRAQARPQSRPERTIENSEVREYSWPAVLVFVSEWKKPNEFSGSGELLPTDFVPKTIYLEDGRSVPVCVVKAPIETGAPALLDPDKLNYEGTLLQPGCAAIAEVQGAQHVATIGCLLSDGHKTYALTNRHVAGAEGEELYTFRKGEKVLIGRTADKEIGRVDFESIYGNWPGKSVYLNIDVGLVELDDETKWSPNVMEIGELGALADVGPHNLSLSIIGCPVRAHGCTSGILRGRIAALFYRYKAVGGFEYIADFLIGARDDKPLQVLPGDSGTVWISDTKEADENSSPVAVQWGGTVFNAERQKFPFALASNLSTVCRLLEVDLVRSRELAGFEYWGPVGHYTIGWFACTQVADADLRKLMLANQHLIGIDYGQAHPQPPQNFVPLADVPDVVWKDFYNKTKTPAGRKGPENPNHYADLDYPAKGAKTLDKLTPTTASLKTATWRTFYDSIGWRKENERGCVPFRVWQIYKKMVAYVAAGQVDEFVAAAGILAHYVGDGCQTLHGSYLTDGDPFRFPDGSPSATPLGHGKGYAGGLHSAYETTMISSKKADIWTALRKLLPAAGNHGMALIKGGQDAGFATIELMRRTRAALPPVELVNTYGALGSNPHAPAATAALWSKFGSKTEKAIADGCKTLAMLWDSAWKEGKGNKISKNELRERAASDLSALYTGDSQAADAFLPSKALNDIDPFL